MRKSIRGFTIVELLITIVVIGVLAALTVVAYSGIRERALKTNVQNDMKTFADKIDIYKATNPSRLYPTTVAELDQLEFAVDKNAYATAPTVGANLLYCTSDGGEHYVLLVYTKSGKKFYTTDTESGEYTGSDNWNASNYPGRCANILPGSASNAFSGYNTSNPDDKWDSWTE